MPELTWIGKDKVINHHLDVPFRTLERQYSFDEKGEHKEDNGSENMIIHGDNLEALKALLPKYEGRVDCIYIDVPYNTGNEGWCYNDNVNDPRIKKWLGDVVGKEGEDLTRHDKWLCMIFPRLKILQKLLSENGTIFISIDDNEQEYLKVICNEIFGGKNFLAQFVWQKRTSPDMRKLVSTAHEYILAYSKNSDNLSQAINKLQLSEEDAENYKNPDNDPRGPWASSDFTAQGYRPNQMYEITTPGGKKYTPPDGRCWKNIEEEYLRQKNEGRMWFGIDGNGIPRRKTYLYEREGKNTWTWWDNKAVGHTQEATKEIGKIFGTPTAFDYPKPLRLIQRIVQISTKKDSIILDSFAGSGTTAHAVLNLNKEDGGKRKFILVEMMDYAETVTAERLKRAIRGYKYKPEVTLFDKELSFKDLLDGQDIYDKAIQIVEENSSKYDKIEKPKIVNGHLIIKATSNKEENQIGVPGDFSYYELGLSLFTEDGSLNPEVDDTAVMEYVWYSETGCELQSANGSYLGKHNDVGYYFFRNKTFNYKLLATIKEKAEGYVVYADKCSFSEEELLKYSITFKKIARDIRRV